MPYILLDKKKVLLLSGRNSIFFLMTITKRKFVDVEEKKNFFGVTLYIFYFVQGLFPATQSFPFKI
jgi:hypothetical protein